MKRALFLCLFGTAPQGAGGGRSDDVPCDQCERPATHQVYVDEDTDIWLCERHYFFYLYGIFPNELESDERTTIDGN